jgi:hypothetical protein
MSPGIIRQLVSNREEKLTLCNSQASIHQYYYKCNHFIKSTIGNISFGELGHMELSCGSSRTMLSLEVHVSH